MGNESDMKVFNSVILLYSKQKDDYHPYNHSKQLWNKPRNNGCYPCTICHTAFHSQDELQNHLFHPAMPDIMMTPTTTTSTDTNIETNTKTETETGTITSPSFPSVSSVGREWKDIQPIEHSIKSTVKSSEVVCAHRNAQETKNIIPVDSDRIEVQVQIYTEFHMKRFKWCCRQDTFELCKYITSRKHLEDIVKGGCILLNGQVMYDNGRILNEGDVLTLLKSYKHLSRTMGHQQKQTTSTQDTSHDIEKHSFHTVRIVSELSTTQGHSKWIVAFKPVGCRSSGQFSNTTLEMIVQHMMELKHSELNLQCRAISLLDTGCAGLCVLFMGSKDIKQDRTNEPKVTYTFTALVHGLVPLHWDTSVYATISCHLRTFKRHKSTNISSNKDETTHTISKTPQDLSKAIVITCKRRLDLQKDGHATVQLSTLSIQSTADHGKLCNVICYTLRKLGFPVVNDRFCKRELSVLPRIMRNILKDKLCIGCYDLKIQEEETNAEHNSSIDPHLRTQCSYWKDILSPK
jgi:hypothetical protein